MHWEQIQFVRSVKQLYPAFFEGVSVLEIGSYNVNGSIRSEFSAKSYVGVDLIAGPGVDVVASGHLFASDATFDVAISTECFEHNPCYAETFRNMVRHVRDGGMVLFTCASDGRAEHGTRRTDPSSSPGTQALSADYYRNLNQSDFEDLDLPIHFSEFGFFGNKRACDLYFVGLKRSPSRFREIGQMMSAIERLSSEADRAFDALRFGRREEALGQMTSVCEEAPIFARSHFLSRKGWLHLSAKDPDGALDAVRAALRVSDTADLHWQLGTVLHARGRIEEALEAAARAAASDPTHPTYMYFLGAMLQARNKLEESEAALSEAIRLDPKLAAAHQQLSVVRVKQNRLPEALEHAETAAALAPLDLWIVEHFKRLQDQVGRDQSVGQWQGGGARELR